MRRWTRWLLYGSILILSVLAVYVAMGPDKDARAPADFKGIKDLRAKLRNRNIPSYAEMVEMARLAGLRRSTDIKGFLEGVKRVGEEVQFSGWGVDLGGEALHLFIFVDGRLLAETVPKGERRDVTRALNLNDGLEENVQFSGKVKCRAGDSIRVLGVIDAGAYYIMNSEKCP